MTVRMAGKKVRFFWLVAYLRLWKSLLGRYEGMLTDGMRKGYVNCLFSALLPQGMAA